MFWPAHCRQPHPPVSTSAIYSQDAAAQEGHQEMKAWSLVMGSYKVKI